MGAVESNTLENIGSLGSALEKIEQKLTQIEDIHLHHEAKICHNDMIMISDKKIVCRTGVTLVVGPVIGLITQTSAKVLVETDKITTLSLNIFLIDGIAQAGQYLKSMFIDVDAHQPRVVTLEDLSPGSRYAVYIGGVKATDALEFYCLFNTIPQSALEQRFLFTYDGHVDRCVPGEVGIWGDLEHDVTVGSYAGPHSHSDLGTVGHLSMHPSVSERSIRNGAHMVFHLGNFLSVDGYLRTAGIQLVRDLSNDDIPAEVWRERLQGIELGLRNIYRASMTTNESVRNILRRTGNIFLCGNAEGGGVGIFDLFKSVPLTLALHEAKKQEGGEHIVMGETEANWASLGEAARDMTVKRLQSQASLSKDQSEICNLVHGMLLRVARRVHTCYLRQLWDDKYDDFVEFDRVENEAHFWMARVLKALQGKRNVRNRMESSYKLLVERGRSGSHQAFGKLKADLHKLVKEVTELENSLVSLYEEANHRGDNSADLRLRPVALASLGGDTRLILVDSIWAELISPAGFPNCVVTSDDGSNEPPIIDLDHSFWEGLQKELDDDNHGTEDAPIDSEHQADGNEEDSQGGTEGEAASDGRGSHFLGSGRSPPQASVLNVIVASSTILLSTSVNGVDNGGSDILEDQCVAAGLGSRLAANGLVSPEDRKRLLHTLTMWKERRPGRGCLVACALKTTGESTAELNERTVGSFSDGWVISRGEGMASAQKSISDERDEDPGATELRLRYVLVAGLSSRPVCYGDGGYVIPTSANTGSAAYNNALLSMVFDQDQDSSVALARKQHIESEWSSYGYLASTDTIANPGIRGFIGVAIAPQESHHASVEDVTGSGERGNASSVFFGGTKKEELAYEICCVSTSNTNQHSPTVVIGPLIGGLTPTSAIVLCEYAENRRSEMADVAVIAVDQVSGMEYVCRRKVVRGKPCVFQFNALIENTTYALLLQNISGALTQTSGFVSNGEDQTDVLPHSLRWRIGTFTTPTSVPVHVLVAQMHRKALKRLKMQMAAEPIITDPKALIRDFATRTVEMTLVECCKQAARKQLVSLRIDDKNRGHDSSSGVGTVVGASGKKDKGPKSMSRQVSSVTAAARSSAAPDLHKSLQLQLDSLEHNSSLKLTAVRILVVGPNRPSWRQHVTEGLWHGDADVFPSTEHIHNKSYSNSLSGDLAHILEGDQLCHSIAGLLQNGWSGVDAVLHCGGNVDINVSLDGAMSAIARAEFAPSLSKQQELLANAEEQMRNAYRLHWGTPTSAMSALLSQGSHICCSSGSAIDLLNATHYTSFDNLINDYSKFCVDNMLKIMEKLEFEYQHSLWPSPHRERINATSTHLESGIHYLNAGSVCIFQLSPIMSLDKRSTTAEFTVQEAQFNLLENILKSGSATSLSALSTGSGADGSHRTPRQTLLTSVVIMSPIQVIYPVDDGTGSAATAFSNAGSRAVKYVDGVAERLLDLLADWAMGKFGVSGKDDTGPDSKEVIFVCPSVDNGLSMRLRCFDLENMVPQRGVEISNPIDPLEFYPASTFLRYKPAAVFKQLCCGPSVGIPYKNGDMHGMSLTGVEDDDTQDGSEVQGSNPELSPREAGFKVDSSMRSRFPLYSPSGRVFVCSVDSAVADPHCGMLVVGGDVKGRRAALKEALVQFTIDKKDHRDVYSARSNKSSGRVGYDHNSEEHEKQRKLELKLSADISFLTRDSLRELSTVLIAQEERRVPLGVQDVWRAVCSLLLPSSKQTEGEESDLQATAPGHIELSPDTLVLDRATKEICKRCEKLISTCFRMNQENLFGGGVLSGQGVGVDPGPLGGGCPPGIVAMLLNILNWLLNEMPPVFRTVFCPPSPLLMKWYWHFFSTRLCQGLVAGFGTDKKITVSPSEIILMDLRENYELFSSLCTNGLRCSALFVQIAGHNRLSNR